MSTSIADVTLYDDVAQVGYVIRIPPTGQIILVASVQTFLKARGVL